MNSMVVFRLSFFVFPSRFYVGLCIVNARRRQQRRRWGLRRRSLLQRVAAVSTAIIELMMHRFLVNYIVLGFFPSFFSRLRSALNRTVTVKTIS